VKYKIGDKVRVRDDLIVGKSYGANDFASGMIPYRGKGVIICSTHEHGYMIDKDFRYIWTDEMLCDEKDIQLELFHLGDADV
jgi:hypothetical protein